MPSTTSSTKFLSSPSPMRRITGSVAVEAALGAGDGGSYLRMLQRLAAAIAHVPEHLRQRRKTMAHLRHFPVLLLHHSKNLQRGDKAVARGCVVRKNDMAGRLAAQIVTVLAHLLEHIAVADRRA